MNRSEIRDQLIQQMRCLGIRVTAQRISVAEVLVNAKDHPTAQELYQRVRSRFPHITMGTVYNTVHTLAQNGLIQPLPFPHGTRYDANPHPHANLVCVQCATITDIPEEEEMLSRLRERAAAQSGFQILSQRLDFYGLCHDCAAKSRRRQA